MVLPWSVCVCACVCEHCEHESRTPRRPSSHGVELSSHPFCSASHKRHRALCSDASVQTLKSCQPRFWSVTKQKMFTTSRAISKHTSSLTVHVSRSCPLAHLLFRKPSSPSLGGHLQVPLLPFKVFLLFSCQACAVDCLLGLSLALGLGPLKTQGKPEQEARQSCDL